MRAEVFRGPTQRSTQVRAADIADEQRVAAEHGMGNQWVLGEIESQDRNGLDRVSGGMKYLQPEPGKVERIAVLHRHERVFRLRPRAQMDGRAATVAQLEVPGDE